MLTSLKTFEEISEYFGITAPAIFQWRKNGIPANRIIGIEKLTKGKITRHQIRPDVFGRRK